MTLNTKVKAFYGGKPMGEYQVLFNNGNIILQQRIRKGYYTVGTWLASTLLNAPSDTLVIDAGADWLVTGMLNVYTELRGSYV